MGTPLFKFEPAGIGAMAFGLSDADTAAIFAAGLEAGRAVIEASVQRSVATNSAWDTKAGKIKTRWSKGGYLVVDATEEQLQREYGDGENPPVPAIRQGLIAARVPAARAIERVINGQ